MKYKINNKTKTKAKTLKKTLKISIGLMIAILLFIINGVKVKPNKMSYNKDIVAITSISIYSAKIKHVTKVNKELIKNHFAKFL